MNFENVEVETLKGRRVYISGPMTGIKDFNRPAFFSAEGVLKEAGAIAINPATLPDGLSVGQYMDIAFAKLRAAEIMVLLPGYQESKGANEEIEYAVLQGIPIAKFDTMKAICELDGYA